MNTTETIPERRLILNVAKPTMLRLAELAQKKSVRIAEIIRYSIAIYSYISDVKEKYPDMEILIDRKDGNGLTILDIHKI